MSPRNTELSRPDLVERALEIADAEGMTAVTVRRLAKEFGVTPMALYWHFANKDELLAAMGDSFYDSVALPADGAWDERLRAVTAALVTTLRRHPGAAHLALARVLSCDEGLDLSEATFAMLRAEGFSVIETADIARTALQTAASLVTQEAGAEVEHGSDKRDEVIEAKRKALAALPVERYPNVLECMECLTDTADEDEYYRFGVDLFVDGVRALHDRVRAESRA
ncbi:TetR/AcrR family transcriptional regulator [Jatrophihabitans endophyticus]|uniref:TetR/AcrR family transcriptional regulator n=1 Tax=Jatrophihabitans endophyticus TaxID=1206085 RepID=UPI0019E10E0E|nr:TetR family transcriptional regulator [Jatrophihabitans endophyticus]MBE7189923.1 TetR family transcriptional regulator [Jatrophihabitans endophyticus]